METIKDIVQQYTISKDGGVNMQQLYVLASRFESTHPFEDSKHITEVWEINPHFADYVGTLDEDKMEVAEVMDDNISALSFRLRNTLSLIFEKYPIVSSIMGRPIIDIEAKIIDIDGHYCITAPQGIILSLTFSDYRIYFTSTHPAL